MVGAQLVQPGLQQFDLLPALAVPQPGGSVLVARNDSESRGVVLDRAGPVL